MLSGTFNKSTNLAFTVTPSFELNDTVLSVFSVSETGYVSF